MKSPKIRFKGNNEDWCPQKIMNIFKITRGYVLATHSISSHKTNEMPFPVYSSQTKNNGLMGYYKDFLYQDAITWTTDGANAGTVNYRDGKFYCTNVCGVLLAGTLTPNQMIAEALNNVAKKYVSYVGNPKLMNNVMAGIEITLPPLAEQQKIGTFFEQIDSQITKNESKLQKLKQLKESFLQKMFPKDGASVPEMRFKGFEGEREKKTIDERGTFYYGKSCPKWSVSNDAPTPCIRYGEMYTKFGNKIEKAISHTNINPENLKFSKGTEVLIPRVGEDPWDYTHCTWLSIPNVAIGEMISVYNTEQNPLFTAMMFNATLKKEFAIRVEGGSVTNLYFEKLKNINVSFPKKAEQEKIALFFEKIDLQIKKHQQKLDKLKQLKQSLLEKMFI